MSAPALGFVFDATAAGLRPIFGVPGAARLAEPLELGFAISLAVVSPQQDGALARKVEDGQMVALEIAGSEFRVQALDGVRPGADTIVFSQNGRSAALHYREARWITVLSGLPANAAITRDIDLSHFPGKLTALAVHDDAATLLAGFSQAETGSLFALTPSDNVLLSVLSYPSAIRFLHHGRGAVASDRASNNIYYVTDVLESGQVVFLASELDGISGPVDIQLSADDGRILVANEGTGVTSITLSSREVQSYAIEGRPDGLFRISGKSVFLLTDPAKGPVLIFDGDSVEPRIVVVPPGADPLPVPAESGPNPNSSEPRRSPGIDTILDR